jgi:uncharacterized protein with HEPN domain
MEVEIKSWLYDILRAISEINSFLESIPDLASFQKDIKTKRAVERNLEIIGEAMNRVLNQDASIQLSNARKIVDTRNRIIHGYDTVSDAILWNIIKQYLPELQREVEQLLH